jgi:hypothetical protein
MNADAQEPEIIIEGVSGTSEPQTALPSTSSAPLQVSVSDQAKPDVSFSEPPNSIGDSQNGLMKWLEKCRVKFLEQWPTFWSNFTFTFFKIIVNLFLALLICIIISKFLHIRLISEKFKPENIMIYFYINLLVFFLIISGWLELAYVNNIDFYKINYVLIPLTFLLIILGYLLKIFALMVF